MEQEFTYPVSMYWRYAWRHRSKAKLFSLYRAIPSLLIAALQFLWLRRNHPLIELVITVSAILVVYAVIFGIETLWRFVVSTPVNIYAQQVDRIGELTAKNSFLEHELKEPSVTAQEQRRREMVSEKVKTLGEFGRKILRCIDDQGEVNALSLHAEYNFSEVMLNNFFAKAVPTGLILYQNHVVRIKPELKSALDFVLSNEYDKDLKE